MLHDLQFGLKMLLKQKAFTAAALLTLALCIGANTAIFAVLNGVALRTLPYPDSGRLVTMYNLYPGVGVTEGGSNAKPDYFDRRKLTGVFKEVALIGGNSYEVGLNGSPRRVDGEYVTPSYFRVLGVRPLHGRVFTEDEAVNGKDKVVVISEGLWKEQFASSRDALSQELRLSGTNYRVIGVMPASFVISRAGAPRLWIPFVMGPEDQVPTRRHANSWGMLARLQPGVSIQQARDRIDALNRNNLDDTPQLKQMILDSRFNTKVEFWQNELTRKIRPTLYLLQIASALVLLIGCVNLANLMLVRANGRLREMAIRFSLGAGRWRIARQLLTETLTLSLTGAALGIGVAYGGVKLLTYLGAKDLPRGADISLDATALLFTVAVAALAGIGFGIAPLIHVMRSDLNEVFRGNERGGTDGRAAVWTRSGLVVCQFAFAFVLLIGAGLLTLTFNRLLRVSPGFRSENVTTAQLDLPRQRYEKDDATRSFIVNLTARVSAMPGVTAAGITSALPFTGNRNSSAMAFVGHPLAPGEAPPVPSWSSVTPGYVPAMGIRVLAGRNFNAADGPDGLKVAIIDEYLAKRYFPRGDAVGRQLKRGLDLNGRTADVCTIIGVVQSVKMNDLAENNPVGQLYFSALQYPTRYFRVVARSARANPMLIPALRNELRSLDPEMPLSEEGTMEELISRSLSNQRAAMALCLAFAALALLLAAIGIYGVLAYSVSQRTREFGIRMALGADGREVVGMVLQQGIRMAAIGLGAGAIGALALTRWMTSMLYDVKPADPMAFSLAALALALVAAVAALAPSARAVRIPPATALRYE